MTDRLRKVFESGDRCFHSLIERALMRWPFGRSHLVTKKFEKEIGFIWKRLMGWGKSSAKKDRKRKNWFFTNNLKQLKANGQCSTDIQVRMAGGSLDYFLTAPRTFWRIAATSSSSLLTWLFSFTFLSSSAVLLFRRSCHLAFCLSR